MLSRFPRHSIPVAGIAMRSSKGQAAGEVGDGHGSGAQCPGMYERPIDSDGLLRRERLWRLWLQHRGIVTRGVVQYAFVPE